MQEQNNDTRAHKGGRKRTGTVAKLPGGRYQVILTLDDGARKRLPPLPKGTTLAMAQEKAAEWAERALEIGLSSGHRRAHTPVSMFSTVDQYVDAVFERRVERGLRRQDNEKARIVNHVLPVLKARKVEYFRDITGKDCRAIVESLDAKISSGIMSAKTARL